MASLPITSIGATISVAIEEAAGVRPISGYKKSTTSYRISRDRHYPRHHRNHIF